MSKFNNCHVHLIGNDNPLVFVEEVDKALSKPGRDIVDVKYEALCAANGYTSDRVMILYRDIQDTPVWDFEEAVAYVRAHTNIDEPYIRAVLGAEEDYMRSIGLIEEVEVR